MNAGGQTDGRVVPAKPPNKTEGAEGAHTHSGAEAVEGRRPAKGNATSKTPPGRWTGTEVRSALERVREKAKARMTTLYRESMRITRATVRQAEAAMTAPCPATSGSVARLHAHLQQTVGLVRRVLAQTRARVLKGDTHHPNKVLSLVEPHTEAIRKGKAAKQTEFGKMVKIQEAEAQFITDYTVCATRVPDGELWIPSLDRHEQLFGRPPRLAVADGSFGSRANEDAAYARGVRRVALPRGRGQPRPRWFQRALRWRTGCEGRISVLKQRHGLARCRYHGIDGMQRWVGLGVIANNLWVLGRAGPPARRK